MHKRICLNMALLAAAGLVLVSVALCLVFYHQFSATVRADLKARAALFQDIPSGQAIAAISASNPVDMRFSLIAADGTVLYDSTVSARSLPSHADRVEIRQALSADFGESKRYSSTLREETCYYAVRLPDGAILRTAKTSSSIFALFECALPVVAAVVLAVIGISYALAGRLTRRIVEPINRVRLDGEAIPPYDELAPFIRAIQVQRERITAQFTALREQTDTIRAIMDNMNEGAVLVGARGRILSANKSALRIFGSGHAQGKNILELMRDPPLVEHTRGALAGRRAEAEMERQGRVYHVYFSPVAGRGAVLLFLDTTESRKAERLRREFSANVSHELKTPLTSISGYAEMLVNGMVREADQAGFLAKIRDESARLLALIEDILLLARLDAEKAKSAFSEVDLAEIATEAAASLAARAAAAGVSVRVRDKGKKFPVRANRSLMAELFANLLDNAIKYNRPGGTVELDFSREEGRTALSVRDSGIGIPPEDRDRVFERFYRVDRSRSKATGGTGLGLAIVKHIALLHQAEVTLESREGEGTRVLVRFAAER